MLQTPRQCLSLETILPVIDPLGKTVTTTYTAADKVASIKDPNNNTTNYSYNGFGEQTNISSPDTGSTTMTYNEGGLVFTHTDARGKLVVYTYDVLGRVTYVNYYDGISGAIMTYDVGTNGVGRLITVQDSTGQTSYSYDFYGRVTSKTSYIAGITKTVSYTRDSVGRVTSITYPSGNVVGVTYAQSRVTNLTLNSSPLISAIDYFPLGGPESWLLGANTTARRPTCAQSIPIAALRSIRPRSAIVP